MPESATGTERGGGGGRSCQKSKLKSELFFAVGRSNMPESATGSKERSTKRAKLPKVNVEI